MPGPPSRREQDAHTNIPTRRSGTRDTKSYAARYRPTVALAAARVIYTVAHAPPPPRRFLLRALRGARAEDRRGLSGLSGHGRERPRPRRPGRARQTDRARVRRDHARRRGGGAPERYRPAWPERNLPAGAAAGRHPGTPPRGGPPGPPPQ